MTGAWYATGGSRWKDLWTLLHLPYTSMVLAYVTIGSSLGPVFHLDRLAAILLAYFLALGGAAHFLDETRGHPWGTEFTNTSLYVFAVLTLIPAVGIGLYYSWTISPYLLVFVILETFFLFAYNLEWFNGRFHTEFWFAFSWAGLPFLTGYFIQTFALPFWTLIMAAALSCTAAVQIALSHWIKGHRRGTPLAALQFSDGRVESIRTADLIAQPQRAIKWIVYAVDFLALALLIRRIVID
jgi:hypothetical protein